jgi:hypothetical protein
MKLYNKVFDIFLYQGICVFIFSWVLYLIDDRYADISFKLSIGSIVMAALLGAFGYIFNLFAKEDNYEES